MFAGALLFCRKILEEIKMNKPNYILKFNDTIPVKDAASSMVSKIISFMYCGFGVMLLWDWNVMAGIIGAIVAVLIVKNSSSSTDSFKWETTPCEWWFDDDHFFQ